MRRFLTSALFGLRPLSLGALLAFGFGATARAACTNTDLRVQISTVEEAWQRFDWPGVAASMARVEEETACLAEWLDSEGAARLHLAHGLAAWASRDEALTDAAFRGLVAARPDFALPEDLALEGSALRAHFDAAGQWAPSDDAVVLPPGTWAVDGRPVATPLAPGRAAAVQFLPEGEGVHTWYLADGTPSAELAALLDVPAPLPPPPPPVAPRAGPSRGLARAAAVVGGFAVVALGSDIAAYNQGMSQPELSDDQYNRLRLVTRVTAPTAAGLGGVAAVLGVVSFATR